MLVPGPADEVEVVTWIYKSFADEGRSEKEIADQLNGRGLRTDLGRPWTRGSVHQILINEKYAGDNVWNRMSAKLHGARVRNSRDMWVRRDGAFQPVVSRLLFDAAQIIIQERSRRLTNTEMLDTLGQLLARRGYLSGIIIDEAEDVPSSSAYQSRFGSLLRAYQLVGFTPDRDYRYIEVNRALRALYPGILAQTIDGIRRIGGDVIQDEATDLLTINGEISVSIVLARFQETSTGVQRWHVRIDTGLAPDITVVVRMAFGNASVRDYYLLPSSCAPARVRLGEANGFSIDAFRFDGLEALFDLAARIDVTEAA